MVHFPFENGRKYTVGELRAFEKVLSAARQNDKSQALTKAWRDPTTPAMKKWKKIREETYPIKLLADHKGYSDEATFCLCPAAFPDIDAEINANGECFSLQITLADPIWAQPKDRIQHGGHDQKLLMEALNKDDVVVGFGNFRRDGDLIVCDDPVKNGSDGANACLRALLAALSRKAEPHLVRADRLLVYARGHSIQVADETFAAVVRDAEQNFEATNGATPFEIVYFVEEKEFAEVTRR